jgi:glutaredoxin
VYSTARAPPDRGMRRAVLYTAAGCHLCEPAKAVARVVCADVGVPLAIVDITGDPDLESSYRRHLPVLEIDGIRAFKYHVDEDELRERLSAT